MVKNFRRYIKKCSVNFVNEKNCRWEKSQGHMGHRNVKCKISRALVIINLYLKFIVHSSYWYAKQVIVLEVADSQTVEQTDPDDDSRHLPKFWLRPKNCNYFNC